jgi:hypothetical protein
VRRIKRKSSGSPRVKRQALNRERVSITREAKYIVERARNFDVYIVTLGSLILFSTETGDARVLDPEDWLALCLAREGKELSFTIVETSTSFGIEWSASYRFDGDKFVVVSQPGRVQVFFGYPTAEIPRAIKRCLNT